MGASPLLFYCGAVRDDAGLREVIVGVVGAVWAGLSATGTSAGDGVAVVFAVDRGAAAWAGVVGRRVESERPRRGRARRTPW
jgi:hypothetical protein